MNKPKSGAAPILQAVTPSGRTVVLRKPRLRDGVAWRRARMSDQATMEPYWDHSEFSWSAQNRYREWVHEYVAIRRRMRNGECIHTVIEADGHFAGQCDAWLERHHSRGELGIWVHSKWAGARVGGTAVGLLVDYLFADVGLDRISAPIACGNVRAAALARQLGFVHEGVMRSYMQTGTGRRDHDLWSLIRADWLARKAVDG